MPTKNAFSLAALGRRGHAGTKQLAKRLVYGYPTGFITNADYIARFPKRWFSAYASEPASRVAMKRFGEIPASFDLLDHPYPSLGVLEIPSGKVLGKNGWAFTDKGEHLVTCSWYGNQADVNLPPAFDRHQRVKGTCLSLVTDFADINYGHYVLDCLPRYGIFKNAGFTAADVDSIYLPKPSGKTAAELVRDLGIPIEKCIWAKPNETIVADRLLVTTFPGRQRDYARCVPEFLQSALSPHGGRATRAYMPRDGARRVLNEPELLEICSEFGVQKFDFRDCAHEPSFFHQAEAVIGPHGASMTNLAFCQPGTKVLELIPSDHMHPYFYTLASAAQLDYGYLVGQSTQNRPAGTFGASPYDFHVSPDAFKAALKEMFNDSL